MNATRSSPKVLKETKDSIRVDFQRTSKWTRFKLKYFNAAFLGHMVFVIFRTVLLIGISYVILYPFFSKISSSFMSREDFVDVTVKLIPKYPTLDTYKAIIRDNYYIEALINTTILSVFCGLVQTFICSLIGYGFAKLLVIAFAGAARAARGADDSGQLEMSPHTILPRKTRKGRGARSDGQPRSQ